MNTHLNTLGSTQLSISGNREDLDFYQTPSYATKTLIERFDFKTRSILEPMAGNGAIAQVFKDAGYDVSCYDIVKRKYPVFVSDYFTVSKHLINESDNFAIVTNPPYELANKFLKYTLEKIRPRTCCVFLPIRYLEGQARYKEIYSKYKPCKVLVYSQRLGCFKESDIEAGRVNERGVGGAVAYMWLCFDRDAWSKKDTKTEIEWVP